MNDEIQIKTDASGQIDTQYYMDQARELRAEYHAELFAAIVKKVKALLHISTPSIEIRRPAHH